MSYQKEKKIEKFHIFGEMSLRQNGFGEMSFGKWPFGEMEFQ
jgi:hypothetical protein